MRKTLAILALIAISTILLASCSSTSNGEMTYSEDECIHTLDIVLRQATDRAIPEMFLALNEYRDSMVPERYGFLNDLRYTIPGMDMLLSRWEQTVCEGILPSYDILSTHLEEMVNDMEYTDPVGLIKGSLTSISIFLKESRGDAMALDVKDRLTSLDVDPWRQVAVQYNSWVSTREKLYGEKSERIDDEMPSDEVISLVSARIVELYIEYLADAETLVRTTPNADMDPVAARVLGLE